MVVQQDFLWGQPRGCLVMMTPTCSLSYYAASNCLFSSNAAVARGAEVKLGLHYNPLPQTQPFSDTICIECRH